MKLYEKILLSFICLLFVLHLIIQSIALTPLIIISVWLLAVSYFFGGYWLLNDKNAKKRFLPIFSGIVFGLSLYVLLEAIRIVFDFKTYFFPIINLLLLLFLILFVFLKRKQSDDLSYYKNLLVRSVAIFFVTGFFTYIPISNSLYRSVLMSLNRDDTKLYHNVKMFDYSYKFKDALNLDDCVAAIKYAEKSIQAGIYWLNIPLGENSEDGDSYIIERPKLTDNDFDSLNYVYELKKSVLENISGTYTNLYEAYVCKADDYYYEGDYSKALLYYDKADKVLNSCNHPNEYWNLELAYSLKNIASCYVALERYDLADSLFVTAIERYTEIKENDKELVSFLIPFGKSLGKQNNFQNSNEVYEYAIDLLSVYPVNSEDSIQIYNCYVALILNGFASNDFQQIEEWINQSFVFAGSNRFNYCLSRFQLGLLKYTLCDYKNADLIFEECIDCFNVLRDEYDKNNAHLYYLSANAKIALAKYDLAKSALAKSAKIVASTKDSYYYMRCIVSEASIDKILGKYTSSLAKYEQSLDFFNSYEEGIESASFYADYADMLTVIGRFEEAKRYADMALVMIEDYLEINPKKSVDILNLVASVYLNYGYSNDAKELYSRVISINEMFDLESSLSSAVAMEGLALVAMERKKFQLSDTLFKDALDLYENILSQSHPFIGGLYLNYARLKVREKDYPKAIELLDKSWQMYEAFFDSSHDVFADLSVVKAEIAINKRESKSAKSYLEEANRIYSLVFNESHPKRSYAYKLMKNIK